MPGHMQPRAKCYIKTSVECLLVPQTTEALTLSVIERSICFLAYHPSCEDEEVASQPPARCFFPCASSSLPTTTLELEEWSEISSCSVAFLEAHLRSLSPAAIRSTLTPLPGVP